MTPVASPPDHNAVLEGEAEDVHHATWTGTLLARPWLAEFWRFLLLMAAGGMLGYSLGSLAFGLLMGGTTYLGWNLYNLHRLNRWLTQGRKLQPPEAPGIWGEVFHHLYLLQKRNRNRKRKLKSYLKRFRESTAVTPDATVVLGERWEILWWNDAATRLIGLRHPQDVGQMVGNLIRIPLFGDYIHRGEFDEAIEIPSPIDASVRLSVRVVPYGKGQRLVVARDVTLLHQLEQVRRDFVANVSHELRTPLTVIRGFLENLIDAAEEDSALPNGGGEGGMAAKQWRRSLTLMHQQSERMEQIVEDLLLLSRLESGERPNGGSVIDLQAMIGSIVEEARALSGERHHRIDVQLDSKVELRGNPKELRSAFSNLVFNAVQYTPPGGLITIEWGAVEEGRRLRVSDTGEGIAAHHIPRLTERFYRVDVGRSRERGGTGLGLAIVKHVLSRHRARLQVESSPGKGSRFSCIFPLSG